MNQTAAPPAPCSAAEDGAAADRPRPHRALTATTRLSVVIPCYNEESVLPLLFERLQPLLNEWGLDYEVIVVDDGSIDRTWEILCDFRRSNPRWKLVRFARNFGHQTALRAGLRGAGGDLVAVLDADLQDPPEVLPELFQKWIEGYDVIYGVRRARQEGAIKRTAYYAFYRLLSFLAEDDIPLDTGDFSVMDRGIVRLLNRMPERKPFIRGLRSWVGFKQTPVEYARHARAAGDPKYSIRKLLGLAVDGIFSSSVLPLRLVAAFGAVVSLAAFFGVMFTLFLKMFPDLFARLGIIALPGTASVVISILFLGGVQLLSIGICGEYVGRIYENVKGRPFWTISETSGLDPAVEQALALNVDRRSFAAPVSAASPTMPEEPR
jgi:dolichol-phosphate mannosyltransferase